MKRLIALLCGSLVALAMPILPAQAADGLGDYDGDGDNEYVVLVPTEPCGKLLSPAGKHDTYLVGSGGKLYGLFSTDGVAPNAEDHFNVDAAGPAQVDLDADGDGDFSCRRLALYAGFTCGFASVSDPSGQVLQDPNIQTGEVNGGPWAVAVATSVTMGCFISVGDDVIDAGDTVVSQTVGGPVGAVAAPVSYQVTPGQDVYLCTRVSWVDADGSTGNWEGFVSDPDGNPYCDLATSIET